MPRTFWLAALLSLCLAAPATAGPVDLVTMDRAARNWLALSGTGSERITGTWDLVQNDTLLARCYRVNPAGHVIVAAWRELPPILASSETTDLEPDGRSASEEPLPCSVTAVLRARFARDLRALTAGGVDARFDAAAAVRANALAWEDLVNGSPSQGNAPRTGAGPLLTSEWYQRGPYNNSCPLGDGGRTAAGCGPIAMAQILRYHSWPPAGVGSHSYTWDGDQSCGGNVGGGTLSATFSDAYDWAHMRDNCDSGCNSTEQAAMAEICYEMGVASEADYGNCGTPVWADTVAAVVVEVFRYSTELRHLRRHEYTATEWFGLVRTEIDAGRPIFYGIEGHAIVCDGWRTIGSTDQIHVNWGDGGTPYSGWWTVDELPGSDPDREYMLLGIRPRALIRPDGTGDYPTIQAAIDALPGGAIIQLVDGIFRGPGNRDLDTQGKTILLTSESGDPAGCVIDCEGSPDRRFRAFRFHSGEDTTTAVIGVTIRNGSAQDGGAILCEQGASPLLSRVVFEANQAASRGGAVFANGGAPVFDQCVFRSNHAGSGGAVAVAGAGNPTLRDCRVTANTADGNGGAIRLESARAALVHSTFDLNVAGGEGSVFSAEFSAPAMEGCTVTANGGNSALHAGSAAVASVSHTILAFSSSGAAVSCTGGDIAFDCTDIYGNPGGDWTGCIAGQADSNGNLRQDPLFCAGTPGDYYLHLHSPCAPENNPGCGLIGAWELGCGEGAVFVLRPDGGGDHASIQAAVDAGFDGVTIVLSPGVYRGPGNRDVDFHGKKIVLRSESSDPGTCTIDCEGSADDRHRGLYFHTGEDSSVVIRGITIRNGYSPMGTWPNFYAGGAVLCNGASPRFESCVFRNNRAISPGNAPGYGGGVRCRNGAPRFTDCVFDANRVEGLSGSGDGGGLSLAGTAGDAITYISGSAFSGNRSFFGTGGGGLSVGTGAVVEVAGCSFTSNITGNDGGALLNRDGSLGVTDCRIEGNHANRGGALYTFGPSELTGCTLVDNEAAEGGAAYLYSSSSVVTRCTLYGNDAASGSGFHLTTSSPLLHNTIVSGGVRGEAVHCSQSTPLLDCCDLWGNAGGDWTACVESQFGVNGNISLDPEFCDSTGGDFGLRTTSPCAPFSPANPGCDQVGAWPVGCSPSGLESPNLTARLTLGRPYPNPAGASVRIPFAIPRGIGPVQLGVFDAAGRAVRVLVSGPQPEGARTLAWDGRDARGDRLAAGVYFVQLRARGETRSGRVVILK